jgi:hypothetical protein
VNLVIMSLHWSGFLHFKIVELLPFLQINCQDLFIKFAQKVVLTRFCTICICHRKSTPLKSIVPWETFSGYFQTLYSHPITRLNQGSLSSLKHFVGCSEKHYSSRWRCHFRWLVHPGLKPWGQQSNVVKSFLILSLLGQSLANTLTNALVS